MLKNFVVRWSKSGICWRMSVFVGGCWHLLEDVGVCGKPLVVVGECQRLLQKDNINWKIIVYLGERCCLIMVFVGE